MANFTTLTGAKTVAGSIKRWVNNDSIDSETILEEAQSWLYRRLRLREMLALSTGSMSTATNALTVPTGYVENRILMIAGVNRRRLRRRPLEDIEENMQYSGTDTALSSGLPTEYCIDASEAVFTMLPDDAYPYRWRYYRELPVLSSSNTANILTTRFNRLLRLACLKGANEFMKNYAERDRWMVEAEAEAAKINAEADLEQRDVESGADYGNG